MEVFKDGVLLTPCAAKLLKGVEATGRQSQQGDGEQTGVGCGKLGDCFRVAGGWVSPKVSQRDVAKSGCVLEIMRSGILEGV